MLMFSRWNWDKHLCSAHLLISESGSFKTCSQSRGCLRISTVSVLSLDLHEPDETKVWLCKIVPELISVSDQLPPHVEVFT